MLTDLHKIVYTEEKNIVRCLCGWWSRCRTEEIGLNLWHEHKNKQPSGDHLLQDAPEIYINKLEAQNAKLLHVCKKVVEILDGYADGSVDATPFEKDADQLHGLLIDTITNVEGSK